jgi:hypothetical protein
MSASEVSLSLGKNNLFPQNVRLRQIENPEFQEKLQWKHRIEAFQLEKPS